MIIADTCLIFHLFNETFYDSYCAQEILSKDPYWIFPHFGKKSMQIFFPNYQERRNGLSEQVINHLSHIV